MCIKHEKNYKGCVDHAFGASIFDHDEGEPINVLKDIEWALKAEIVEPGKAESEVKDLIDSWHEKGWIKPTT